MQSHFQPEQIPPRARFEKLFSLLPALPQQVSTRGRPPFARDALLRVLIYQRLHRLSSLTDLAFELETNLSLTAVCGFPMLQHPPSRERFSFFLRTTSHIACRCWRFRRCPRLPGTRRLRRSGCRRRGWGGPSPENRGAASRRRAWRS